jgi:predicted  nucleic acid-binding Zn-ribbon protein
MKYVFNYQKFIEKLEIIDTDEPDVKMSKEKMNALEDQFTEFNQKKAQIDAVYQDDKLTDKDVESKLKSIIGQIESGPEQDRNTFLIEYSTLKKLEREVSHLQGERTKDKLKIQEFQEELSLLDKEETKLLTKSNINDLNTKLAQKSAKILEIGKSIQDKKKEMDQKMMDVKKEIDEFNQKMKDEEQK